MEKKVDGTDSAAYLAPGMNQNVNLSLLGLLRLRSGAVGF